MGYAGIIIVERQKHFHLVEISEIDIGNWTKIIYSKLILWCEIRS